MVFNGEGCATIVLLYTYTESVEKKKYDEEGKEMLRCYPPACLAVTKGLELGKYYLLESYSLDSGIWILESGLFLASSPDMI